MNNDDYIFIIIESIIISMTIRFLIDRMVRA